VESKFISQEQTSQNRESTVNNKTIKIKFFKTIKKTLNLKLYFYELIKMKRIFIVKQSKCLF
jgi:hypothetical protein